MNTKEILMRDWAMDHKAADSLSSQLTTAEEDTILESVSMLDNEARNTRDTNRNNLNHAFDGLGIVAVIGACSLDIEVEYNPLFDFMQQMQSDHPDVIMTFRGNGSKPRSGTGWRGPWASTLPGERSVVFDVFKNATERGIPVITEITDAPQLGELAPFMSAQWVGARDSDATSLRHVFQGIQLATGVKNGMTSDSVNIINAIETIRSNSEINDGSGFNLGSIAGSINSRGVPTGILPVGRGNQHVAIFARGYPLPKNMPTQIRRQKAIEHLSVMCTAAEKLGSAVLIDGTHSVAPMFNIDQKDSNRFIGVLREISLAIQNEEIENSHRIKGIIGEVGPEKGRTDPNFILNGESEKILSESLTELLVMINR